MKRKDNILRESWEYLKESRYFLLLAIMLFAASAIVGYIFAPSFGFFDSILKDVLKQTEGLDALQLIIFIFRNNFMSALLAIVFGVLLGIFPIFNALMNGALIGYVSAKAVSVAGFSILLSLVPHGIFELPAIFIAIGLGVKLGTFVFVPAQKRKKELLRRVDRSLKVIVTIILPLLVIAAIIEGILIAVG